MSPQTLGTQLPRIMRYLSENTGNYCFFGSVDDRSSFPKSTHFCKMKAEYFSHASDVLNIFLGYENYMYLLDLSDKAVNQPFFHL